MNKITYLVFATTLILTPVFIFAQSSQNTSPLEFTRSLSLGMQGDDVKLLQEFLARDSSIYPDGLATGYFGAKTQEAVKKWQQKYGIDAVGIVGKKTIAKIKEVNSSKTEPSQKTSLPTENNTTTPTQEISAQPDTTPPNVILSVGVPSLTSVYIQYVPSEEVTAVYEYGRTINYGSVKEVTNQYSASPAGVLIENLLSSTTYQVRAKVTDKAGNVGYSQNYTFATPWERDTPSISYGPTITPNSSSKNQVSVNISWGTNIDCDGTFYYGNSSKSSGYSTNHNITIDGLGQGVSYVYKIHCATAYRTFKSDNFTFVATSTNTTSSTSNQFLANILNVFEKIIQKFKIGE